MAGLRPAAQSWSARRPSPHWPSLHTPALTWPPGSGIRPTQDSPAEPRRPANPPGGGRPAAAPPRLPCRRDCSATGQGPATQQAPPGRTGPARPASPSAETSPGARPGPPGDAGGPRPAAAGRRQGRLRLCLGAPGGRHQVPRRGCRLRVSSAGRLPSWTVTLSVPSGVAFEMNLFRVSCPGNRSCIFMGTFLACSSNGKNGGIEIIDSDQQVHHRITSRNCR